MRSKRVTRALFICGSLNQTRQLHAVARELPELTAFFSPYYGDRTVNLMRRARLIELSIGGNRRRRLCVDYLREAGLALDVDGRAGPYDLVVTCTDLLVPKNVRGQPLVVVQEGIFDPDGRMAALCRKFRLLPRWSAGTALTGESGLYDRFCAASEGYRERLLAHGAAPHAVVVTGIPGFDDCRAYLQNDFPHRGYVLVCTSDTRETFKRDDRRALVERALRIAAGRELIFKLHPNENEARSRREIERYAPNALVFQAGSAEEMIANSDVLITQWSSTVFVGMALGKEVYSNFEQSELERLLPWQNGGSSAARIAEVCRELLARRSAERKLARAELSPWHAPSEVAAT
jgi:hypothetical protein